jgi:hypothetical protein
MMSMVVLTIDDRDYLHYFLKEALENLDKNKEKITPEKYADHFRYLSRIKAQVEHS